MAEFAANHAVAELESKNEMSDETSDESEQEEVEEHEAITSKDPTTDEGLTETLASKKKTREFPWVSVEAPYWPRDSYWWLRPLHTIRNYQYSVLAFKHEASLGHVPFASQITYTQWCMSGLNSFAGDGASKLLYAFFGKVGAFRQVLGREKCLTQSDDVRRMCDMIVVYEDYGSNSSGVQRAIALGETNDIPVIRKRLPAYLKNQIIGESVLSTVVPVMSTLTFATGVGVLTRGGFRTGVRLARRLRAYM